MRGRLLPLLPLLVAMSVVVVATDDDWPQFRGPGALGVSDDTRLPESWSTTENGAWVTDIPGCGWISPIVRHDQVFVTTVVSTDEIEAPRGGLAVRAPLHQLGLHRRPAPAGLRDQGGGERRHLARAGSGVAPQSFGPTTLLRRALPSPPSPAPDVVNPSELWG